MTILRDQTYVTKLRQIPSLESDRILIELPEDLWIVRSGPTPAADWDVTDDGEFPAGQTTNSWWYEVSSPSRLDPDARVEFLNGLRRQIGLYVYMNDQFIHQLRAINDRRTTVWFDFDTAPAAGTTSTMPYIITSPGRLDTDGVTQAQIPGASLPSPLEKARYTVTEHSITGRIPQRFQTTIEGGVRTTVELSGEPGSEFLRGEMTRIQGDHLLLPNLTFEVDGNQYKFVEATQFSKGNYEVSMSRDL